MAALFAGGQSPNAQQQPIPAPFGGARQLGILNLIQQRNPALLSRLGAHFPTLGAGGIPPAFGMGRFPQRSRPSY